MEMEMSNEKQRVQMVCKAGRRQVNLSIGDDVMIDDHGLRTDKRCTSKIVKQTSSSTYVVQTKNDAMKKRHIDQIIKGKSSGRTLHRSPRLNSSE